MHLVQQMQICSKKSVSATRLRLCVSHWYHKSFSCTSKIHWINLRQIRWKRGVYSAQSFALACWLHTSISSGWISWTYPLNWKYRIRLPSQISELPVVFLQTFSCYREYETSLYQSQHLWSKTVSTVRQFGFWAPHGVAWIKKWLWPLASSALSTWVS